MPSFAVSAESRKNSTPALSTVTTRSHSSCTHCSPAFGQVPHDAPVSAPSLTAVTEFQPDVYDAVGVAIGAMLPSRGASGDSGTVTVASDDTLPAASLARRYTTCFWSSTATGEP